MEVNGHLGESEDCVGLVDVSEFGVHLVLNVVEDEIVGRVSRAEVSVDGAAHLDASDGSVGDLPELSADLGVGCIGGHIVSSSIGRVEHRVCRVVVGDWMYVVGD